MKLDKFVGVGVPMRDLARPKTLESKPSSNVLERDLRPDVLKLSSDGILVKDRTATDNSVLPLFLNDKERRHLLHQLLEIKGEKRKGLTLDMNDRICDSSGKPIDTELAKRIIAELKF